MREIVRCSTVKLFPIATVREWSIHQRVTRCKAISRFCSFREVLQYAFRPRSVPETGGAA